jgi:23S rRNA (pseudouridine1915-N3)-methyltransferase
LLKIRVLALGKDKDRWVNEAANHYLKLLTRFASVELVAVPSPRLSPSQSPGEIRAKEAKVLQRSTGRGFHIAMSDRGKRLESLGFARFLDKLHTSSGGMVEFWIGGPHGLADEMLHQAELVLSLSPLTFPHQLARIILLEQLYRAFSILHNTDYHK